MDRTPVPAHQPNDAVEAYRRLLTVPAMTGWTADREETHRGDAADYRALLAAMQGELRSEHVPGDNRWSAGRRTRRATKGLRKMIKAADLSAEGAQDLREAFADHVRDVAALPAQRAEKAARRSQRRATVGAAATKALHKSAAAPAPAPAEAVTEQPHGAEVRGITDLWDRRRGA